MYIYIHIDKIEEKMENLLNHKRHLYMATALKREKIHERSTCDKRRSDRVGSEYWQTHPKQPACPT